MADGSTLAMKDHLGLTDPDQSPISVFKIPACLLSVLLRSWRLLGRR
jgi:hypothetical protein